MNYELRSLLTASASINNYELSVLITDEVLAQGACCPTEDRFASDTYNNVKTIVIHLD